MKLLCMIAVFLCIPRVASDAQKQDWGNLKRYAEANKELVRKGKQKDRVVFMGNSITEGWVANDAAFFEDNGYVGRGIGGQTSSHFLLRFREDVIKLAPALVVINAGTNDIAENAGAYNEEYTFGNIVSMVELARANKIKVILTSVLPAAAFGWNPSVKDAPQKIMQLNARIRKYAQENKIPYVDYYSEMVEGDNKALNSSYTLDGVHPTLEGYKVMDVSPQPSIAGAPYVDLTKIEGEVDGFAKDEPILLVCAKGKRGYMTQNRMKYYGYTNTKVLEGGLTFNEVEAE